MEASLGGFDLRAVRGSGSAATVYEAFDPKLNRRIALKVVRLADLSAVLRAEVHARFRQEAQITAALEHPGVLTVFGYDETPEVAFLAMEFVDGESLKELLDGPEKPPIARVVAIMIDVLRALEHCHRRGVVHRDIKPSNLLLPRAGGVKVADFGIARPDDSNMGTLIGTRMGTWIGTPPYMSPEQFTARTPVDARTDIWSCGVVLYELLTGRRPFRGDENAIAYQVVIENPPAPSTITPGVPAALDAVVARALTKDPRARFATAGEFADALGAALAPRPAMAGGVGRVRRWLAPGLVAAVVLASGIVWWERQGVVNPVPFQPVQETVATPLAPANTQIAVAPPRRDEPTAQESSPPPAAALPPTVPVAPVPPYSQQAAQDLILAGTAPPTAWHSLISELSFSYKNISSLSLLQNLPALRSLNLSGTKITDFAPLRGLTALQELKLADTAFTDLAVMEGLSALHNLHLGGTKITDFARLRDLRALQSLHLDYTEFADLTLLQYLPALKFVFLLQTNVTENSVATFHAERARLGLNPVIIFGSPGEAAEARARLQRDLKEAEDQRRQEQLADERRKQLAAEEARTAQRAAAELARVQREAAAEAEVRRQRGEAGAARRAQDAAATEAARMARDAAAAETARLAREAAAAGTARLAREAAVAEAARVARDAAAAETARLAREAAVAEAARVARNRLTILQPPQASPSNPAPSPTQQPASPPSPNFSREYAALIGRWRGYWGGQSESSLIVEEIDSSGRARGLYIFRDQPPRRFESLADKGVIQFGVSPRPTLSFVLNSDGRIEGTFKFEGNEARIQMTKSQN